jgi:hypothetical protein
MEQVSWLQEWLKPASMEQIVLTSWLHMGAYAVHLINAV